MRFPVVSGVAAVALALPLAAQTGSVSRSVRVSVTNVDVVVTDGKGRPVADLGPLDFVVTQDGVPQVITNFSFVRNASASAAPPVETSSSTSTPAPSPVPAAPPPAGARLSVFVDMLHLTESNRNRAVASLAEFLPRTVGPRVEVQVVTWDRVLRARGSFTNDGAVLASVLESLKGEAVFGDEPARERNRLYGMIDSALNADPRFRGPQVDQAISTVRSWCDNQAHEVEATLDAARSVASTLAGLDGRRILIVVTERLAPAPGRELWDYLQRGLERVSRSQRVSTANMNLNDLTWKDFDRTPSFRRLASTSNGAGVSLFMVDASGLTGDATLSAEFGGTGGSVNEGLATLDADSALHLLAEQTGGAAIVGRNNLALALESLEPAWTAYYSLGFESSASKPGVARPIRVTVKRPGVSVLTRRSIVERTDEQKIADAVLSGVHFPRTFNPLRATLRVGTPSKSGKLWLVPLEFNIPFDRLTLVPESGRARGRILFTFAAATADGRVSEVSSERVPVDVPERDLSSLAGKAFTYTATLKVRPGPQILSLALTDEIALKTSYVQPHVLVGDKPRAR
jgi:VWFA-related protein